jgi:hypothetical protein
MLYWDCFGHILGNELITGKYFLFTLKIILKSVKFEVVVT